MGSTVNMTAKNSGVVACRMFLEDIVRLRAAATRNSLTDGEFGRQAILTEIDFSEKEESERLAGLQSDAG